MVNVHIGKIIKYYSWCTAGGKRCGVEHTFTDFDSHSDQRYTSVSLPINTCTYMNTPIFGKISPIPEVSCRPLFRYTSLFESSRRVWYKTPLFCYWCPVEVGLIINYFEVMPQLMGRHYRLQKIQVFGILSFCL